MTSDHAIVVVDDERHLRRIVCRILAELGHATLLEADDGKAALSLVSGRPDVGLILLDLDMPNLGGMDFLRLIRGGPAPLKQVPVLIMSGHSSLENLREAADLGIHGFLVKPVSRANLERQVRRALSGPPLDPSRFADVP